MAVVRRNGRANTMSFSSSIKNELSRIQNKEECCNRAELAGLLRTGLMFRELYGKKTLLFITEHASVSRLLYSRTKELIGDGPEISGKKATKLKKHVVYRLNYRKFLGTEKGIKLLDTIGIHLNLKDNKIEYGSYILNNRCCIRAYLRGGFLGVGSMSNPDKSYHLEMAFTDNIIAEEYKLLMEYFQLKPRQITRKRYEIVYMKEGQDIVDFLNIVGAHQDAGLVVWCTGNQWFRFGNHYSQ
jgi:DNA-binding protein WhiA